MATRKNGRPPTRAVLNFYRLQYFNGDWEEEESLRVDEALPREVLDAVERWLFEREVLRVHKVKSSPLVDAVYISIGGSDEED